MYIIYAQVDQVKKLYTDKHMHIYCNFKANVVKS